MFSDIPSHPRQQLLRISSVPVKEFSMSQRKTNMPDNLVNDASNVLGPDRMKFFKINVLNFPPKDLLPYRTLATFNIRMVITICHISYINYKAINIYRWRNNQMGIKLSTKQPTRYIQMLKCKQSLGSLPIKLLVKDHLKCCF